MTMVEAGGLPYDRPPLSKDYLLGAQTLEQIQFQPREWFAENRVTLIEAEAVSVEANAQPTVRLSNGDAVAADRIVLATGGSARKLPVPGGELAEVLKLRTRADADRLRDSCGAGAAAACSGRWAGAGPTSSSRPRHASNWTAPSGSSR
ncbi:FAD-dependent oxidoreductase [Micrococcoides hystricis]|uniref:FAD-dependent oxidoreductase n=1 Tax=Micrococcoides hystricis TaxID=1572761 RepID=A0ABV6PC91_9MICC